MKKVKESTIENSAVKRAKELGFIARKMNGFGHNHWPDRMFLGPDQQVCFVEFKRPGESATPGQQDLHETLRSMGFDVRIFHDANTAVLYLKSLL